MTDLRRRRTAGDGDDRTAEEMMDDLLEMGGDAAAPAVRSVRVTAPGTGQPQPEGGDQNRAEAVAQGEGQQIGQAGEANGVMEGLSPEQQAVLAEAAAVLRSGVRLRWQAAPPDVRALGPDAGALGGHEGPPGDQQLAVEGDGNGHGDRHGDVPGAQGGDGGLLGPLAIPLGPLELRPADLPPLPQGNPQVFGPGGHHEVAVQPVRRDVGHHEGAVQPVRHDVGQGHGGGRALPHDQVRALPAPGDQGQPSGRAQGHPSDPRGLQVALGTPGSPEAHPQVNPFWSPGVRAMVRSGSDPLRAGGGQLGERGLLRGGHQGVQGSSAQELRGGSQQALPSGERVKVENGLTHKDLLDLEAMKLQGMRDLEAQIQREMLKRKEEASGGSGSFQSVVGDGAAAAQSHLCTPPGILQPSASGVHMDQHGTMPQGMSTGPWGAGGLPPHNPPGHGQFQGGMQAAGAPMMGESLTESLRNLKLPKLAAESNAVDFGDWLALVGPLMADLGGTSSQWWALVLGAATESYTQWTQSTPLERLRLKVGSPQELSRWPRTEQRAVTMLLAAIPEPLRKDLISSRKLKSIEIIYALLCRYQPGGVHEKTVLIKDITETG